MKDSREWLTQHSKYINYPVNIYYDEYDINTIKIGKKLENKGILKDIIILGFVAANENYNKISGQVF